MYKKALNNARGKDQKKVGFNLQVPVDLKIEFENMCKEDGVSMTSMLNSLMEVSLEERNSEKYENIRNDIDTLNRIFDNLSPELLEENKSLLLDIRKRFKMYTEQFGDVIPDDNEWQASTFLRIDHYSSMIDGWLDGLQKMKKKDNS